MHRRDYSRTAHKTGADASVSPLSDDQIGRLADEMIADGHCELPKDLTVGDLQRLRTEIGCRLRQRLIRVIVRAIALDLHGVAQRE